MSAIFNISYMIYGERIRVHFFPKQEYDEFRKIDNPIKIKTTSGNIEMDFLGGVQKNHAVDVMVENLLKSSYFTEDFSQEEVQNIGSVAYISFSLMDEDILKSTFCIISPHYWPSIYIRENNVICYHHLTSGNYDIDAITYFTKTPINSPNDLEKLVMHVLFKEKASRARDCSILAVVQDFFYTKSRYKNNIKNLWSDYVSFNFQN